MKALREAVEVAAAPTGAQRRAAAFGGRGRRGVEPKWPGENPSRRTSSEGLVKVEIGPLGDFSQLVGFEDAAGQIDATSEISVERFSEGRATLSMRLEEEPVELLRELEARSPLGFHVRHTAADNLILDIDEDQGADGGPPHATGSEAPCAPGGQGLLIGHLPLAALLDFDSL